MPRTFGVFTNKIDYINKVDDIEKSNSKILHFPLNKPEYNLSNKDIEKSLPAVNAFFFNKRNTNPLKPKYKLPVIVEFPPEIPKFIHDSININDIKGSSPKNNTIWKTRDTFPKYGHNIEGTKAKEPYLRKKLGNYNKNYHFLNYSDVTQIEKKSKRNVNVLDPIYSFSKKNDMSSFIGPIEKSKPTTY